MAIYESAGSAPNLGPKLSAKERRGERREFQAAGLNILASSISIPSPSSDTPSFSHDRLELESSLPVPSIPVSEIAHSQELDVSRSAASTITPSQAGLRLPVPSFSASQVVAVMNFALPSTPNEFSILPADVSINFAVPTPYPSKKGKGKKAKRLGKKKKVAPTADPTKRNDTLIAIGMTALSALERLGKRGKYPDAALDVLKNIGAHELADLVTLGKAHASYGFITTLYEGLPKHILSRGSLTASHPL
ncbi:hypothetical protein DFH09DRAFT_1318900 [Mycena vulgaris]|nr:hypothetical protein DFH09DRAFT_1318900 [Mycena vulgaris]